MSDGFPDRVTQLRARWQSDPTSRVFLQLAEEYRHLGRLKDALEVLEAGLAEHPGYLSALVAKGRCLLELGEAEAARDVLERVVLQDVTQMVASKLLVRAYLEVGDAERARQRLDLYGLLNDGDPEIEDLKRRVEAMSRPLPVEEGPLPASPSLAGVEGLDDEPFSFEEKRTSRQGDVFDLDSSQLVTERPAGLPRPDAAPVWEPEPPVAAAPAPAAPPVAAAPPAPAAAPAAASTGSADDDDDPFPELTLGGTRRLQQEHPGGLFSFERQSEVVFELEPPAALAGVPAETGEPEAAAVPIEAPAVEAGQGETITAPWEVEPEPHVHVPAEAAPPGSHLTVAEWAPEPEPEPAAAEPEPVAPPAAPPATATLGQLYQRQGHISEAERIFRAVLERDPNNPVAQAELARITSQGRPLEAGRLLAGFDGGAHGSGVKAKKTHLLTSYLQLIRRASRNHVP